MLHDLRTACRALRRAPGLALVVVLTIAIGIAANATAFAWFKGVALDPLPQVRDARALVHLRARSATQGGEASLSYPDFVDWRAGARRLDGAAAYAMERFGLRDARPAEAGRTESVWGNYASAEYFTTLGVRPALGRFWTADEAATPGGAPVAVLSDALWRRRYAADPHVVGRTVWVNGVPCTVIGVAPPRFAGAFVGMAFDLWVPVTLWPRLADWKEKLDSRTSHWLFAVARPRPGTTLEALNAELQAVGARVAAANPGSDGMRPFALPFDRGIGQRMITPLFALLCAAAVLVQLVVCANVANLLLARTLARRRELGVRAALGAGRGRLVRELAAEALVLSAAGAALGVLAATGAGRVLASALPEVELPVALDVRVDWRVLAAGAALAAATVLLAGVLPAWRGTGGRQGPLAAGVVLAAGGRAHTARRRGARALVVGQLACSLVALVGAALFARSHAAVTRRDAGIAAPERVLVAFTDLTLAGRTSDSAGQAIVARWLDRVRALPGVAGATVSDFVPLGLGYSNSNTFLPAGYRPRPGEPTAVLFNAVGGEYFATLGIPILRGRAFADGDDAQAPRVAIVNEAYVRRYLAGRDPIGAAAHYNAVGAGDPTRIVGVARDGRYDANDLAAPSPQPLVYVPAAQRAASALFVQVRARPGLDPRALVPGVRAALAAADPALPLVRPTTLDRWSAAASFVQRLAARALGALAAIALALAAVGLYAVMAHVVASRRRELGIRLALGATAGRVLGHVLGDAGRTAALGLALGGLVAVAAARLLRAQLVGVSALDPIAFGGAAALLAGVALAASWLPARRAARVDPNVALRIE